MRWYSRRNKRRGPKPSKRERSVLVAGVEVVTGARAVPSLVDLLPDSPGVRVAVAGGGVVELSTTGGVEVDL